MFSCERDHRSGGGVLLYVKASLHPISVQKPAITNIDACYVQVKTHSRKITLCLIYRPPAQPSDIDCELYDQLEEITCEDNCIIFGDFNLPVTEWGGTMNSHSGQELYSNLNESALYQHVTQPTRGDNILDILLTTNENLVNSVYVGAEFSTSDHRIISFNINVEKQMENVSEEKVPDYRKANFSRLRTIQISTGTN